MKKIISAIGTAVVAAVMTVSSLSVASAAPVAVHQPQITSSVELAQYRDERRLERRHDRREYRRDRDRRDRAELRRERRGYWKGHRGYREHRRGYRRHTDGYYYAPDVFRLMIR